MDYSEKAMFFLRKSPVFKGADDKLLKDALKSGSITVFQKGELVFSRASGEKLLGMMIDGSASVLKDKLVISRLLPGDIFGAVTLFSGEELFLNDIEADGRCAALFISGGAMRRIIHDEPPVAAGLIEYLSERIYFLNRRIEAFTAGRAEEMLYVFLSVNSDEEGCCRVGNCSELARKLGVGRATLYRSLDILEESGRIAREGKTIRLL